MKALFFAFALLLSSNAFAGPSISGGTSEAPWVRSQQVFGLVLEFLNKNLLEVKAINFSEETNDVITAVVNCGSREGLYEFTVHERCREGLIVPVCIPERSIKLSEDSLTCK